MAGAKAPFCTSDCRSTSSTSEQTRPRDRVLGPLNLPVFKADLSCFYDERKDSPIPCLLCEEEFSGKKARDEFLRHLFTGHKIVIGKTCDVASFKCYAEYWRRRLAVDDIKNIMAVIKTHPSTPDPSEEYFFLGDAFAEDKELRLFLQKKRLVALLEIQHSERMDKSFDRGCLFCPQTPKGNRSVLFSHMLEEHGFSVGLPDNLVFVGEFIDLLQHKLDSLQCLFCERTFKDKPALKDHMRKKGHRKINPRNKDYDKFYIINYLEFGKTWEELQYENDAEDLTSSNTEDWQECVERSPDLRCLFCMRTYLTLPELDEHMEEEHRFSLLQTVRERQLSDYQQIKVINYIRRQIHNFCCPQCQSAFESAELLLCHMTEQNHCGLPWKQSAWDQPEYLFPTYENDSLLFTLEDC